MGSILLLDLINELLIAQITYLDSSSSASLTSYPSERTAAQTPFVTDARVLESGKPSEHGKSSRGLNVSQSILNYWATSVCITASPGRLLSLLTSFSQLEKVFLEMMSQPLQAAEPACRATVAG